jgi:hypothetical protein
MASEDVPADLPATAVHLLEREQTDVYLIPGDETTEPRCMFVHPIGVDVIDTSGIRPATDSGRFESCPLSDLSRLRDTYEERRDRLRHSDRSEGEKWWATTSLTTARKYVDILVIVERAVAYVQAEKRPDRHRHYARIDALCEDAHELEAIIETVAATIDPPPNHTRVGRGWPARLRTAVNRWLPPRGSP